MSNVFFPFVDGLGKAIPVKVEAVTPQFSTDVQRSQGGSEFRVSRWAGPRWSWKISVPVLPDASNSDAYRTIIGFFMERQGMADSFLWCPPSDSSTIANGLAGKGARMTSVQIGIGDGTQLVFPVIRPFGPGTYPYGKRAEIVQWIDTRSFVPVGEHGANMVSPPGIVSNGMGKSIVFPTAPGVGVPVLVTCEVAYRVRFGKDAVDFKNWCWQLYRGGSIELEQVFE